MLNFVNDGERNLIEKLYTSVAGLSITGIEPKTAVELLRKSGLNDNILREIWSIVKNQNQQPMTKTELLEAVRLVNVAQSGSPVSPDALKNYYLSRLPFFKGFEEEDEFEECDENEFEEVNSNEETHKNNNLSLGNVKDLLSSGNLEATSNTINQKELNNPEDLQFGNVLIESPSGEIETKPKKDFTILMSCLDSLLHFEDSIITGNPQTSQPIEAFQESKFVTSQMIEKVNKDPLDILYFDKAITTDWILTDKQVSSPDKKIFSFDQDIFSSALQVTKADNSKSNNKVAEANLKQAPPKSEEDSFEEVSEEQGDQINAAEPQIEGNKQTNDFDFLDAIYTPINKEPTLITVSAFSPHIPYSTSPKQTDVFKFPVQVEETSFEEVDEDHVEGKPVKESIFTKEVSIKTKSDYNSEDYFAEFVKSSKKEQVEIQREEVVQLEEEQSVLLNEKQIENVGKMQSRLFEKLKENVDIIEDMTNVDFSKFSSDRRWRNYLMGVNKMLEMYYKFKSVALSKKSSSVLNDDSTMLNKKAGFLLGFEEIVILHLNTFSFDESKLKQSHCDLCFFAVEEGDKTHVFQHEFHFSCINFWLNDVTNVSPYC